MPVTSLAVKDASGATQTVDTVGALLAVAATATLQMTANTKLDSIITEVAELRSDVLTDSELRATPVPVAQNLSTPTNRAGVISVGGTAQVLMGANGARRGFSIQNLSTGDLWLNFFGTAANSQPSFRLEPGDYFSPDLGCGMTGSISIYGASSGQEFSAMEW